MSNFFSNYSKEQLARIVTAIFLILGFFGYKGEVGVEELVSSIDTLIITSGFLVAFAVDVFGYFRRLTKGDVTPLGKRI